MRECYWPPSRRLFLLNQKDTCLLVQQRKQSSQSCCCRTHYSSTGVCISCTSTTSVQSNILKQAIAAKSKGHRQSRIDHSAPDYTTDSYTLFLLSIHTVYRIVSRWGCSLFSQGWIKLTWWMSMFIGILKSYRI